ncbi:MAG TPA: hypothetical protein DDW76_04520 [Cyanobacteria bacterium UBA11369]|nr:hypothetical protein [Cyanobacteria bacterium UBA11371]HBE30424.1 hypothetical protein [Cyanobacteria bacterium UBA11368]HBE48074.1 hypothetical protein [Cyanobacteria bacterium UBA11369]
MTPIEVIATVGTAVGIVQAWKALQHSRNGSFQGHSKWKTIPWVWLAGIFLMYLSTGWKMAPGAWASAWATGSVFAWASPKLWASALAWLFALLFYSPRDYALPWASVLALLFIFGSRELIKFFSKPHKFLILAGTSWLGLALGLFFNMIFGRFV